MELIPLYSGSSGNCTLVRANGANILVDAGKNCKAIKEALAIVGTDPSSIDAVLITHSHSDHVQGLDVFIRKFPSKIYATRGTFLGMSKTFKKPHDETPDIIINPGEPYEVVPGVIIEAISTPHDASGSCCYKINDGKRSCMIATDLGYMTDDIMDFAKGVDAMLIESNYDVRMLVYGEYPEDLKARIAGEGGHMSNDECAQAVKFFIDNGTRKFFLGHLSENNNTPGKAESTVCDYLASQKLINGVDYEMRVANRYAPTEGFAF